MDSHANSREHVPLEIIYVTKNSFIVNVLLHIVHVRSFRVRGVYMPPEICANTSILKLAVYTCRNLTSPLWAVRGLRTSKF